jgi:hypothetical protein
VFGGDERVDDVRIEVRAALRANDAEARSTPNKTKRPWPS